MTITKREPQINVAFRISEAEHAIWKRTADQERLSLAGLIRVAMAEKVAATGQPERKEPVLEEL